MRTPASLYRFVLYALTLHLVACDGGTTANLNVAPTVDLQILAFNDFHGNLEQPASGLPSTAPDPDGKTHPIASGGVARLATLVQQRAVTHSHSIIVAAGDLIGGSPMLSSRFHDEPTIESLNAIGLSLSTVGNHEFDKGLAELQRMQNGGCHPEDGCQGPAPFKGAGFQYLAANVIDERNGQTIFPAHAIRAFDGIRVGFIGVTLRDTPLLLSPVVRQGLQFLDEASAINREAAILQQQGIEALVVLIHEGGAVDSEADACTNLSGAITTILPQLDKSIDVVISGHTHQAYNCVVDGKLLTSAGQYGTRLTDITLTLDRASGDITSAKAENLVVDADLVEDSAVAAIVADYSTRAAPLMQRRIGSVTAPIDRTRNPAGEMPMGSMVADAMREAATHNTGETIDVAFINPSGVRSEFSHSGDLSFAEVFSVLPFANTLMVMTLTGAEIEAALAQQFDGDYMRILQVSDGFQYQWRQSGDSGAVVAGSIRINGEPLQPERAYRIATNNFVADGGDGFPAFKAGKDLTPAGGDVEALEAYIAAHPALTPPAAGRVALDRTTTK